MRRLAAWPIALGIALTMLAATGCAPVTMGSTRRDEGLEEVKRRVVELQRQARVAEVEIERLRRQVAELEARLGVSPAAPRIEPESAAGRGSSPPRAAEEEAATSPAAEPRPIEQDELELRNEIAAPAVRSAPPGAPREEAAPAAGATGAPMTSEAQALYDRGYTLYHQGRHVDAETAFQQFLQAYGNTELSDNAQYWIGEARFARQDVQGALAAFRETAERFPEANKVPDAMLRAADCLTQLGDREGARKQYSEVVRRFPNTAAAAMAEERRSELR